MTRYIIRRLLLMIPLLIGVTFLTFAIINLVPGSPYANVRANPKIKPQDVERVRHQLGLDQPWPERYLTWLSHLARGDLGRSLFNNLPVRDRIFAVLPNTLLLTSCSLLFALMFAIPIGIYAASKHRSLFDRLSNLGSIAVFAVPNAWLAVLLVILFAFKFKEWGLPALPATGLTSTRGGGDLWDRLQHLILPTVALGLIQIGGWSAYIRSSMLEAIHQDYVRTARAKGLSNRVILFGHAFRNAFLPLITLVGLSLPGLFGGALLVESVFAWPGMGLLTYQAIQQHDYTMIMGTTLMFSFLTILFNLAADVAYAVADPRIHVE